jgi:hypothetical protein
MRTNRTESVATPPIADPARATSSQAPRRGFEATGHGDDRLEQAQLESEAQARDDKRTVAGAGILAMTAGGLGIAAASVAMVPWGLVAGGLAFAAGFVAFWRADPIGEG